MAQCLVASKCFLGRRPTNPSPNYVTRQLINHSQLSGIKFQLSQWLETINVALHSQGDTRICLIARKPSVILNTSSNSTWCNRLGPRVDLGGEYYEWGHKTIIFHNYTWIGSPPSPLSSVTWNKRASRQSCCIAHPHPPTLLSDCIFKMTKLYTA